MWYAQVEKKNIFLFKTCNVPCVLNMTTAGPPKENKLQ